MDDTERGAVARYLELISAFVTGSMSAADFEDLYPATYLADTQQWSDPAFQLLDRLFADVDFYVADDDLREPAQGDLDEDGLRTAAQSCLTGLSALV